MIVVLIWRPQGLFARARHGERDDRRRSDAAVAAYRARAARWSALVEIAFWVVGVRARIWLLPSQHLLLNEIAILGAVRALARPRARLCRHRLARPRGVLRPRRLCRGPARQVRHRRRAARSALARCRRLAAAVLGFITSFLVLRGTDLTRLMVTLGVALMLGELANRMAWLTGGADGLQGVTIGADASACSTSICTAAPPISTR